MCGITISTFAEVKCGGAALPLAMADWNTTCLPWFTINGDASTSSTCLQCLTSGLRRNAALAAYILPCWQVGYIAISACLQCEPEPGDIRAMALLATLRKRLSLARASLPGYVRELQVRMEHVPCQAPIKGA